MEDYQKLLEARDKRRENSRAYYRRNKERILEKQRQKRQENHTEYLEKQREYCLKYWDRNREQLNEYKRNKYKERRNVEIAILNKN